MLTAEASASPSSAPNGDLVEEDRDTDRLVDRARSGDSTAFPEIYSRYFDRVYAYLRVAVNDPSEAEDATQRVFISVLEALPEYVRTDRPFRAWLFRIARNRALDYQRSHGREAPEDPVDLDRRRDTRESDSAPDLRALAWTSDEDLLMLIERLPEVQRQAIMLRYVLGFDGVEIAQIMDRTPESVRQLHSRALRFLEQRFLALGRTPRGDSLHSRRHGMRRTRRVSVLRPAQGFTLR